VNNNISPSTIHTDQQSYAASETNIIIIDIRPELLLNVFRSAKCSIGPVHRCLLLVLRTEEPYHHTAEAWLSHDLDTTIKQKEPPSFVMRPKIGTTRANRRVTIRVWSVQYQIKTKLHLLQSIRTSKSDKPTEHSFAIENMNSYSND